MTVSGKDFIMTMVALGADESIPFQLIWMYEEAQYYDASERAGWRKNE